MRDCVFLWDQKSHFISALGHNYSLNISNVRWYFGKEKATLYFLFYQFLYSIVLQANNLLGKISIMQRRKAGYEGYILESLLHNMVWVNHISFFWCIEMKTSFLQGIMFRFKHSVWIFSTKYNWKLFLLLFKHVLSKYNQLYHGNSTSISSVHIYETSSLL